MKKQLGLTNEEILLPYVEAFCLDPQTRDRLSSRTGVPIEGASGLSDVEIEVIQFLRSAGTGAHPEIEQSAVREFYNWMRVLRKTTGQ